MENDTNKQQFSLEIKPEVAKGTYSNLAIITHSHSEFIIDFATILPGLPKPDITSRIVMTPEHADKGFRIFIADFVTDICNTHLCIKQ